MKKKLVVIGLAMAMVMIAAIAFTAYHHEGETDSGNFLEVYPEKAGTKLDHCALCHSGGEYEKNEEMVSLGSCQWCHYSYGYDGSGNIVDTLNSYGKDYLINGRDADAIRAIQGIDSDEDGFTNQAEIEANRFPGNAADDPDKKIAPYKVYTREELEALPQHTQFLLMNTSRSGDFYAEYTGVPMEDLLKDAGVLDSATNIVVYAPDGWSQYHPLEYDETPEMYPMNGTYPAATYQYDPEAESWCDYSAPSCVGRNHNDPINVDGGLKAILAYQREGINLDTGILTQDNKLDGEGPYRVVVPQKVASPPDQSSKADDQDVIWAYNYDWDHNAGACTRSATIIKVEPLPEGTTDIDLLEAGWSYIDQEKIIVYGAIAENTPDKIRLNGQVNYNEMPLCTMILANGQFMFSCDENLGAYDLGDVPLDEDGKITLFAFCDGLVPFKKVLTPDSDMILDIDMQAATPDTPEMTVTYEISTAIENPDWVKISGYAIQDNDKEPVCAMVLANGQHMFTCDVIGAYELEVPLDANGEITLFGFCEGMQPFKQVLKP